MTVVKTNVVLSEISVSGVANRYCTYGLAGKRAEHGLTRGVGTLRKLFMVAVMSTCRFTAGLCRAGYLDSTTLYGIPVVFLPPSALRKAAVTFVHRAVNTSRIILLPLTSRQRDQPVFPPHTGLLSSQLGPRFHYCTNPSLVVEEQSMAELRNVKQANALVCAEHHNSQDFASSH